MVDYSQLIILFGVLFLFVSIVLLLVQNVQSERSRQKRYQKHFVHRAEVIGQRSLRARLSLPFIDMILFKNIAIGLIIFLPVLLILLLGWLFHIWAIFAGVGLAAVNGFLCVLFLFYRQKQQNKLIEQLPSALEALSQDLQAGKPMVSALESVAEDFEEPLGPLLRDIVSQSKLGRPFSQALFDADQKVGLPEFSYSVMVMNIHQHTGTDPLPALFNLIQLLYEERLLKKKIKSFSADGRISAFVISLLPLVMLYVLYAYSPRLMPDSPSMFETFLAHPSAPWLALYALISYIVGLYCMYRVVRMKT